MTTDVVWLEVHVRLTGSSLALGGYSAPTAGGDKATAVDDEGRPLLPASALRGALRIELERLLRAVAAEDGRDAAICGPTDAEPETSSCACEVCRLFGRRDGMRGSLRLDDGRLPTEVPSPEALTRTRVAVDRRRGSAVDGMLAFLETHATDPGALEFIAPGALVPLPGRTDVRADLRHLQAAARSLSAIGGGRGAGLGWVECSVVEVTARAGVVAQPRPLDAHEPHALRVRFVALAPLHFGAGRPIGTFAPTLGHAPPSTVRGALAFALLEHRVCAADAPVLASLFHPAPGDATRPSPSIGSARRRADLPLVTARTCRSSARADWSDVFVDELVRRAACAEGIALDIVRPCAACDAHRVDPQRTRGPQRRVRTRTAVHRRTGSASEGMLFSVETLVAPRGRPLVLEADVRGLSSAAAEALLRLQGRTLWLGGRRSNGFGTCRAEVSVLGRPDARPSRREVERAMESVGAAVRTAWRRVTDAAGRADLSGRFDRPLLRVVLDEAWAPEGAHDDAAILRGPLGDVPELELVDAFLAMEETGAFVANESALTGAPAWVGVGGERTPTRRVAAGSTFLYGWPPESRVDELGSVVETVCHRAEFGCGASRELGGGRYRVVGASDEPRT